MIICIKNANTLQVNWVILGPNSQEALPPQNTDIADPVSGSFSFGEGEGGVRAITLIVYPHEDVEVEEIFIIKLELVKGEAKLDSRAKEITLTVSLTLFFPQHLGVMDLSGNTVYIC